ncbi:MAG: hypothetical protein ACK5YG_04600 [Alphaproteobacteria bacterium]
MPTDMHIELIMLAVIALLMLTVVLLVELMRQSWRANRCKALAEQRKAEADTHSHDHHVAEGALRRISEIASREERTRILAIVLRFTSLGMAVALTVLAIYINLPQGQGGGTS